MRIVNMLDAKTNLSKLVEAVENGSEDGVIISRNGKPAAKLTAVGVETKPLQRLGFLDGKFPPMSLESFNSLDEDVEQLFLGAKA